MLLVEAGVFCRFLLLRFRRGPPVLPETDLPMTMTGGGGEDGPGGQGGAGAVLQAASLTHSDSDTGDTVSDDHVRFDPGEPEVIILQLDVYLVIMDAMIFLSIYELDVVFILIFWLYFPPNSILWFQGQGSVGEQAQDEGHAPAQAQGQSRLSLQVQQPGLPDASLLDLASAEQALVPVLPAAPMSSGDEYFIPVSASSHSLHGAVGELPNPGPM